MEPGGAPRGVVKVEHNDIIQSQEDITTSIVVEDPYRVAPTLLASTKELVRYILQRPAFFSTNQAHFLQLYSQPSEFTCARVICTIPGVVHSTDCPRKAPIRPCFEQCNPWIVTDPWFAHNIYISVIHLVTVIYIYSLYRIIKFFS